MGCEEQQVVVGAVVEIQVEVVEDVDDVEGKPAHPKNAHHQHQHLVGGSLFPQNLLAVLLLLRIFTLRHLFLVVLELAKYAQIADEDDQERQEKLQDGGDCAEQLPNILGRPGLVAQHHFSVVDDLIDDFHVVAVRRRQHNREGPHDTQNEDTRAELHSRPERENYHKKSIDGDGCESERRQVHATALEKGNQMAQKSSEYPATEEGVGGSECYAEAAQQNVGNGEVTDEKVRNCLHCAGAGDDKAHQKVAEHSQQENDDVEHREDKLHEGLVEGIVLGQLVAGMVRRETAEIVRRHFRCS